MNNDPDVMATMTTHPLLNMCDNEDNGLTKAEIIEQLGGETRSIHKSLWCYKYRHFKIVKESSGQRGFRRVRKKVQKSVK